MKLLLWMLLLSFSLFSYGQESVSEIKNASENAIFKTATAYYTQGKYQATVEELKILEANSQGLTKTQLGILHYWKGICYNRLQDFFESIQSFDKALGHDYNPQDLSYEYGQALFAADKLNEARLQFRESVKKKFKRAVSLYYIGFISKELGEKKKAVSFFKALEKIDPTEAMEVRQAAEVQIGDIYLEQVEKHPDAFRAVESYVIPQYKRALEFDKNSSLAPEIQEKILSLQRKYDLVLFRLRNGRATLIPPYFLRVAAEVGMDSNVTFAPTEQEISESKKKSPFVKTDAIGRYTFYHRDFFSVSPEMRINYTRYLNREEEIFRNDNYLLAPAIRTAYEHKLWNRPASILFDYDYADAKRDINSENKLEFASRSHTLMLGERFNYFTWGESIVRLRQRIFDSFNDSSDSKSTSIVYEQIRSFSINTLLMYASYDMTRVEDDVYDTNSLTLRADFIMGRIRDWFTPSFGLGITRTNPLNNDKRGIEYLINPSARLSKTFGKNWRGNLKFDYQDNKSEDEVNFAYKKYIYSFELEYLF
jgi:tetratricopeptide (TPR) repeat protein